MSIESVMPSNHLIPCLPLLLLSSIFLSIRIFSQESAFCIRWPKYWSFSFSVNPFSEYSVWFPWGLSGWISLLSKVKWLAAVNISVYIIPHFHKQNNTRCWEPAWGTPPVAKVMRKEARHTQRRDLASGVPLEILEHLPPKPESASFTTLCSHLHLWLYGGGCPPLPLSEKELT